MKSIHRWHQGSAWRRKNLWVGRGRGCVSKSMRRKAGIDPAGFIPHAPPMSTWSISMKRRLCPVRPERTRINLSLSTTAHLMKDIMAWVGREMLANHCGEQPVNLLSRSRSEINLLKRIGVVPLVNCAQQIMCSPLVTWNLYVWYLQCWEESTRSAKSLHKMLM